VVVTRQVSTQQTYAKDLPRWVTWCAGHGLDPLTARRADIELRLRSVADSGLSRASVAAHYDVVASIYRLAPEEIVIAVNPCIRIPRPKVLRELQRRKVPTVPEYPAFLTAARALGPTHHAIAVLGGMLGLRQRDDQPDHGIPQHRPRLRDTDLHGQGRQARRRAGAPARLPAVQAAITAGPVGRCCAPAPAPAWTAARWVFVGEKSGPLQRNNVTTRVWNPVLAKVPGLPPGLHFHDGRGLSATIAARHGATTMELMRHLGHASPALALRYQRAEAERDAILAQAMSRSVEATRARGRHASPAEGPRTA
jgi:integrase